MLRPRLSRSSIASSLHVLDCAFCGGALVTSRGRPMPACSQCGKEPALGPDSAIVSDQLMHELDLQLDAHQEEVSLSGSARTCSECGAEFSVRGRTAIARCEWCGSTHIEISKKSNAWRQPDAIAPVSVHPADAHARLNGLYDAALNRVKERDHKIGRSRPYVANGGFFRWAVPTYWFEAESMLIIPDGEAPAGAPMHRLRLTPRRASRLHGRGLWDELLAEAVDIATPLGTDMGPLATFTFLPANRKPHEVWHGAQREVQAAQEAAFREFSGVSGGKQEHKLFGVRFRLILVPLFVMPMRAGRRASFLVVSAVNGRLFLVLPDARRSRGFIELTDEDVAARIEFESLLETAIARKPVNRRPPPDQDDALGRRLTVFAVWGLLFGVPSAAAFIWLEWMPGVVTSVLFCCVCLVVLGGTKPR